MHTYFNGGSTMVSPAVQQLLGQQGAVSSITAAELICLLQG
jgi:hypothetical protein